MAHDPALRARLAGQLEALETTARTAKVRERNGRHAELKCLRELATTVMAFGARLNGLADEIEGAET